MCGMFVFGRVPRPFPSAGSLPAHQPIGSSVCQSSDSFARQPVSPPLRPQGARNCSPLPFYRERRMLSIQGFSMLRMPFWEISCASVSPIWRKSVERVVIPPARISLSGVSLYEMMPNSRPGVICCRSACLSSVTRSRSLTRMNRSPSRISRSRIEARYSCPNPCSAQKRTSPS